VQDDQAACLHLPVCQTSNQLTFTCVQDEQALHVQFTCVLDERAGTKVGPTRCRDGWIPAILRVHPGLCQHLRTEDLAGGNVSHY